MHLYRRVEEIKLATMEWKSNLSKLSIGESGLTLGTSNEFRQRVTLMSEEVKKLESDMKQLAQQLTQLQETSRYFHREIKHLQLSVFDASRVCKTRRRRRQHSLQ